jgi:hypothetical protein
MQNPFAHLLLFVYSVWDHVFTLAAGCVLTVVINLIEKYALKGRRIPLKADLAILLAFLLFACFQAWRDQYQLAQAVKQQQPIVQVNVPPITVPPSQVIIERTPDDKANAPLGYLQIGEISPGLGFSTIAVGRVIGLLVEFENKSTEAVTNVHNFGSVNLVGMADPSAEQRVQEEFKQHQQRVHENSRRLKGEDIGIGQHGFNGGKTEPLTQKDVDDVMRGTIRIYLQVWASWSDMHRNTGHLSQCWWIEMPNSPELTRESMMLGACKTNY